MNEFTCETCNKVFNRKQHLKNHKNKKNRCKQIINNAHINQDNAHINQDNAHINNNNKINNENVLVDNDYNNEHNNKNICNYCHKLFSRTTTLKRHVNGGYCPIKNEQRKIKQEERDEFEKKEILKKEREEIMKEREIIFRLLLEKDNKIDKLIEHHNKIIKKKDEQIDKKNDQIIDLIKEVQKPNNYKKVINTNNGSINTNNTTVNNNVNIKITQFGNEDYSQIDDKYFQTIVRNPRILGIKVPGEILKIIHFNSAYPQLQNFYISDFNREKIMVHDGKNWNLESPEKIKSVLEQIIEYGRNKIDEYREKNLSEDAIKRLKRIEDAMNKCDDDFIADLREMAEEEENNILILEQIKLYEEFQKKVLENIKKTSYNEGKIMMKNK